MKLVRYGNIGKEKPGLIDSQGRLRSLAQHILDIDADTLSDKNLARIRKIDEATLPIVKGTARVGCPVARIGKFLAIGLNYADHAAEAGMPVPKEPILFSKATSCIVGPNDDVCLPSALGRLSKKSDWEVELGVVVGTRAKNVTETDALKHVAGYCVVNDLSEREYQLERGGTWDKGKGCDSFGPIGPWLVTRDEVPNPQLLGVWLDLNGKSMQRGNTRTMVFGVAQIISYVSQFMTLNPGDVIATGTPPGVGMGIKKKGLPAPRYLKRCDQMTLGIEGLGRQIQRVV